VLGAHVVLEGTDRTAIKIKFFQWSRDWLGTAGSSSMMVPKNTGKKIGNRIREVTVNRATRAGGRR